MKAYRVFLFSFLLMLIILGINKVVQFIGEGHYSNPDASIVYDIVHQNTPDLHSVEWIVNVLPVLIIASLFFLPITNSILEEFLGKFILIFAIRALTTISTILPKHEECILTHGWDEIFTGGCYDKIFSGHTSFTALWTLIFTREKFITPSQFWMINIYNMTSIVLTRAHYTVDVILGFIITYLVYDGDYSIFSNFFHKVGK